MEPGVLEEKLQPRSVSQLDGVIGARIRARRQEIGVSQERLADAIGVTFQQVQKYEKGINRVSAATLYAIADALDTTVSQLLPDAGPPRAQLSPDLGAIAAEAQKLSEDGRRLLLALAKTLAADKKLRG
jgi:transcriptional regulator with XRE-family HTH domain